MLLKKGSSGEDVEQLQKFLGLTPDGDFGNITESKVKEWQSSNSLKPDGIVGDVTWNKMIESVNRSESTARLNIDALKSYLPNQVFVQLPKTIEKFNISTRLQLAHFLAQCAHESGDFKKVVENTNYKIDRMLEIFKSDFDVNKDKVISEAEKLKAQELFSNPDKIANFVYANQNGNGNEASGDGWRFRGRGYIQLTGRSNYRQFSKYIGEDCVSTPEIVAEKYALASAAFFFTTRNIWKICDLGSSADIVEKVTLKVNGGINGLSDRIAKFNKFYSILK